MTFMVVLKLIGGFASVFAGGGLLIGALPVLGKLTKKVDNFKKNAKDLKAEEAEINKLLLEMGSTEDDIGKLNDGDLKAYYRIRKLQAQWIHDNQDYIKSFGVDPSKLMPTFSFEKIKK